MPENHEKNKAAYLKSLDSIRAQCTKVFGLAQEGKLAHFDLDLEQLPRVVDCIQELIQRDYDGRPELIPPHGRWRHFGAGRVERLAGDGRALVDLIVVSVLLDAGAGDRWSYVDPHDGQYCRSEGLAVASFNMFCGGLFSSDAAQPRQADAKGLQQLTLERLSAGLQVSKDNPIEGLEGRLSLLHKLGQVLSTNGQYFGGTMHRPSNLINFLKTKARENVVDVDDLWQVAMDGFGKIWPESRTKMDGVSLGDTWTCDALRRSGDQYGGLVPFHKLSQWLVYSIIEPIEKFAGLKIANAGKLTGLAEYRNGGLFVDLGVLKLKEPLDATRKFNVDSQLVVEWRALTVILIDMTARRLGSLSLAQVLEAGTWKAGREVAARLRPGSKAPPIAIVSDGTVF